MAWKKLLTAHNDLEAEMICGLLNGEGIPTQRRYKGVDQYLKIIMGPVVAVEIWVPEEHIEEALAIVKSFSGENLPVEQETENAP